MLSNDKSKEDFIDVHLDEEYMNKAYAQLQSVVVKLVEEPAEHQSWFRKSTFLFVVYHHYHRLFIYLFAIKY